VWAQTTGRLQYGASIPHLEAGPGVHQSPDLAGLQHGTAPAVWREQTRTGALGSRLVQHCKPLFPVDSLVGRTNPWTTAYEARAYVSRMATVQNADRGKNPRRIRKSGGGNTPPIESVSGGARAEAENLSLRPRPTNKPGQQHVAMLLQFHLLVSAVGGTRTGYGYRYSFSRVRTPRPL